MFNYKNLCSFLCGLSVSLSSVTVFAVEDKCLNTVVELAQFNLDSKAKAYGFKGSDIVKDSVSLIKRSSEGRSYLVDGHIYKATYKIKIVLDSSCGVEAVLVTEVVAD